MNFRFSLLVINLLYLVSIAACNNSPNNSVTSEINFQTHSINKHVYRSKNTENELIINFSYLVPTSNSNNLNNVIANVTFKTLASFLNIPSIKNDDVIDSEDKLIKLTDNYVDTFCNGEIFHEKEKWELKVDEKVAFENDNIVSVQFDSYQVSGNTKAIPLTIYKNFDKSKAQTISLNNLTNNDNLEALTQIGELEFRRQYKIHPNESFSNTPFMFFENNKFKLPDNFVFVEKGILFTYNIYEIAPYSEGKISFIIPYEKINDIIDVNDIINNAKFSIKP